MDSQRGQADTVPSANEAAPSSAAVDGGSRLLWCLLTFTGVVIAWWYWDTFVHLVGRWSNEPEYSHGFFVPLASCGLLWLRREQMQFGTWQGTWWGLIPLLLGVVMRIAGAYGFFALLGALAILPVLCGLVLLVGGLPALRWSWASIGFLAFMIPLPGFASEMLAQPLQRIATTASTYLLQTFGIAAVAEGNVILLDQGKIGVVEACSGLRMLILFFAVSAAVAIVVQRSVWERVVILASAVPIALLANIVRITLTGVLYEIASPEFADRFFHDLGGWLMGPLALLFLWLELRFLDQSMISVSAGPLAIGR